MNWKEHFQSPPIDLRPMPFWFLNHDLEREELARQIQSFKDQGLGGFVLHARCGLTLEYMSDEWMACVRFCIEEARSHGLKVWLSDEENWPSGTAGGEVTKKHPEYRQKRLIVVKTIESAPGRVVHLDDIEDEITYMVGVTALGNVRLLDSEHIDKNTLDVPADIKKLYFFATREIQSEHHGYYLDTLNPQAVKAFIQATHERYREGLGELAKEIEGFYTVGPRFGNFIGNEIPWTDDLPRRFQERYEREIWEVLPSLIVPGEKVMISHRCQFLQCVTDSFIESYFKTIKDFCQKHDWLLLGHTLFEGDMGKQASSVGDIWRVMEVLDYASCETRFDGVWEGERSHRSLLAAKLTASVQRLLDKPKAMTEAFNEFDALSLGDMNRIAGMQAAMGLNAFIPLAAYYSMEGFRKWDGPAAHSYQQPFWPHYHKLSYQLSRMCSLMQEGESITCALVLYPMQTCWGMFSLDSEDRKKALVWEEQIGVLCQSLINHQRDFDLIAEDWLTRLSVNDEGEVVYRSPKGKIKHYQTLILPLCRVVRKETLNHLQRLVDEGAKIHFIETIPDATSEEGYDESVRERIQAWIDVQENAQLVSLSNLQPLMDRVKAGIKLGSANPDLLYQHRLFKEGDIFLLYNASNKEILESVGFPSTAQYVYEADTEQRAFNALPVDGPDPEWEIKFAPGQSRLFVMTCNPIEDAKPAVLEESEPIRSQPFDETYFFFTQQANELPLREWNLKISPSGMGQEIVYRTTFWVDRYRGDLHLVCDGLHHQSIHKGYAKKPFQIMLNGFEITEDVELQPHDDHMLKAFNIKPYVLRGENVLEIHDLAMNHEPLALNQALILRGEFALIPCEGHHVLTTPSMKIQQGSWTTLGYPFYSGTGVYRQEIILDALSEQQRALVQFDDVRNLVEVGVNGIPADTLWKAPWEIDVTEHLREGKNQFEFRITNTLANRRGDEEMDSGLIGPVRLNVVRMK